MLSGGCANYISVINPLIVFYIIYVIVCKMFLQVSNHIGCDSRMQIFSKRKYRVCVQGRGSRQVHVSIITTKAVLKLKEAMLFWMDRKRKEKKQNKNIKSVSIFYFSSITPVGGEGTLTTTDGNKNKRWQLWRQAAATPPHPSPPPAPQLQPAPHHDGCPNLSAWSVPWWYEGGKEGGGCLPCRGGGSERRNTVHPAPECVVVECVSVI